MLYQFCYTVSNQLDYVLFAVAVLLILAAMAYVLRARHGIRLNWVWWSLAVMTLAASDPAPLPMAVRPNAARAAIDAILRSGGRRSLLALADAVPSATLPEEAWRAIDPGGATLRDVDAPDDLAGG